MMVKVAEASGDWLGQCCAARDREERSGSPKDYRSR